jgi:hypothetical protein
VRNVSITIEATFTLKNKKKYADLKLGVSKFFEEILEKKTLFYNWLKDK